MGLRISRDIASAAKPNWRVPFEANIDRSLEDLIDNGASAGVFGSRTASVLFDLKPPNAALMIDAADESNRSPPMVRRRA